MSSSGKGEDGGIKINSTLIKKGTSVLVHVEILKSVNSAGA